MQRSGGGEILLDRGPKIAIELGSHAKQDTCCSLEVKCSVYDILLTVNRLFALI